MHHAGWQSVGDWQFPSLEQRSFTTALGTVNCTERKVRQVNLNVDFGDDATLRLAATLSTFALFATWELVAPRRASHIPRRLRWTSNISIALLDALVVRFIFPGTAVAVAMMVEARGWGLLQLVAVPAPLAVVGSLIVLDLMIYGQHRLFHRIPVLWRLHRMHHADLELDVTSGARFHPLEIVLSMLVKTCAIIVIGAPASAVLLFEVLLNCTALFNHSNIRIPPSVDRVLRWCVVTPDMHRVHHSVDWNETNSNFGFNLPWWDHVFRSYRAQPEAGHTKMTIGIAQFRTLRDLRLDRMLVQPLRSTGH